MILELKILLAVACAIWQVKEVRLLEQLEEQDRCFRFGKSAAAQDHESELGHEAFHRHDRHEGYKVPRLTPG